MCSRRCCGGRNGLKVSQRWADLRVRQPLPCSALCYRGILEKIRGSRVWAKGRARARFGSHVRSADQCCRGEQSGGASRRLRWQGSKDRGRGAEGGWQFFRADGPGGGYQGHGAVYGRDGDPLVHRFIGRIHEALHLPHAFVAAPIFGFWMSILISFEFDFAPGLNPKPDSAPGRLNPKPYFDFIRIRFCLTGRRARVLLLSAVWADRPDSGL